MNDRPPPASPWPLMRRLMLVMLGVAIAAVAVAFWYFRATGAPMELHFLVAVALGITLSLLLTGALMGLIFHSSRSGHDASIRDTEAERFEDS